MMTGLKVNLTTGEMYREKRSKQMKERMVKRYWYKFLSMFEWLDFWIICGVAGALVVLAVFAPWIAVVVAVVVFALAVAKYD